MGYWTVWLGCLIGILLAITAFRFVVHHLKWPTIVAVSVAVIVICLCYWISYYIAYGGQPNMNGLFNMVEGVWGEAVRMVKGFGSHLRG